jgi:hypothetical protein
MSVYVLNEYCRNLSHILVQLPVYADDSDIEIMSIKRILWGKCINLGQTCIAPGYSNFIMFICG